MLKFEILKSSKSFNCNWKLCSAPLSNPKGDSLTPEARKTQKLTKIN